MKVCYVLARYISHRRAGLAYRDCLAGAGVSLVETPDEADVVVLHVEPWQLAGYYRAFPGLRERRVIAYAVWETDRLPAHYLHNLALVGEIWTCSAYCRDALVATGKPVTVVPHITPDLPDDPAAVRRMRERLGIADGVYVFYTITSAGNVRKGLDELLGAHDELFGGDERVRLVVKTRTPLAPGRAGRGVVGLTGVLDDAEIGALHRLGDCLVSAHRSEGWGLTLAEAMSCGRLVVATAHGGNLEFMDASNSLPVACEVAAIRPDEVARQPGLLSPGMRWAYVDGVDLRRQMRRAVDERERLGPLTERARETMRRFSAGAVRERLLGALGAAPAGGRREV